MKFIRSLFHDQAGEIDEKRVLGIPTFALGILFAVVGGAYALVVGKPDLIGAILSVAGFISGSGLAILGIAVVGDQGRLGTAQQRAPGGGQ